MYCLLNSLSQLNWTKKCRRRRQRNVDLVENLEAKKILVMTEHKPVKESTASQVLHVLLGTKCKLIYPRHSLTKKVGISIASANYCNYTVHGYLQTLEKG